MKFSNIFEKLEIIFKMIIGSNIFTVLLFLIIAILLLRLTNKITNKKTGLFIYLIEIIILAITFIENKSFLIPTFNKIIDNIFLNFYFPSIYIYLFISVLSVIIFIYTLLNRYISKTYKTITNIYFLTFNFIFILLINNISKYNIDVFAKESLFTNNSILVLLELSTSLFFVYLLINSLVYFTNSLILFVETKKVLKEKTKVEINNNLEITIDTLPTVDEKEALEIDLVPEFKNFDTIPSDVTPNLVPEVSNGFRFIDPMLFEEDFAYEVIKNNYEEPLKEKLIYIFELSKDKLIFLNKKKMIN